MDDLERISTSKYKSIYICGLYSCLVYYLSDKQGTVLSSVKFNEFLDKNEIIKIRADWTNSDPSITRELNKIGRNGVPTYVLYGPNDYHFIFPEILTEKNTINSIRNIINNNG